MNKLVFLLGGLLLVSTSKMHAQMDASIKLNEVMTDNNTCLQEEYGRHEAWFEIATSR